MATRLTTQDHIEQFAMTCSADELRAMRDKLAFAARLRFQVEVPRKRGRPAKPKSEATIKLREPGTA